MTEALIVTSSIVQSGPWPSAMARSMSPAAEQIGWWREDLDLHRHMIAKRSSENLNLHLSQFIVLL